MPAPTADEDLKRAVYNGPTIFDIANPPVGQAEGVDWQQPTQLGMATSRIVPGTGGQSIDTTIIGPNGEPIVLRRVANGAGGYTMWMNSGGTLSVLYSPGTAGAEPGRYRQYTMAPGDDPSSPSIVSDVGDGGANSVSVDRRTGARWATTQLDNGEQEISVPEADGVERIYRSFTSEMGDRYNVLVGERRADRTGWFTETNGLTYTFNPDGSQDIEGYDHSTGTQKDLHRDPFGRLTGWTRNDLKNEIVTFAETFVRTTDLAEKPRHVLELDKNGKPVFESIFDKNGDMTMYDLRFGERRQVLENGYEIEVKDPWRYTVWAPDHSRIEYNRLDNSHKGYDNRGIVFEDSAAGDSRGFTDKNVWENIVSAGAGLGSIFTESYKLGETLSWVREHDPGTAAWYLEQQRHDQAVAGLKALVGMAPEGGPSLGQAWGGMVTGIFATHDFARGDYAYAIPKAAVNVLLAIDGGIGLAKGVGAAGRGIGSAASTVANAGDKLTRFARPLAVSDVFAPTGAIDATIAIGQSVAAGFRSGVDSVSATGTRLKDWATRLPVDKYLDQQYVREALAYANANAKPVKVGDVEVPAGDAVRLLLPDSPLLQRTLQLDKTVEGFLLGEPRTIASLIKHPKAIEILHEVITGLRYRIPFKKSATEEMAAVSKLTDEQLAISDRVATWIKDRTRGAPARQSGFDATRMSDLAYIKQYLAKMEDLFDDAQADLKKKTDKLAEDVGGKPFSRTERKHSERSLEKIIDEEKGDAAKLLDMAGSKIIFDTVDEIYRALDRISESSIDVVRMKDRLISPMGSGYRDILLNVRTSTGMIGELRLHLRSIENVSEAFDHAVYEVIRGLERVAKIPGTDKLTPAAKAIIDGVRLRTNDIFSIEYTKGFPSP